MILPDLFHSRNSVSKFSRLEQAIPTEGRQFNIKIRQFSRERSIPDSSVLCNLEIFKDVAIN